MHTEITDPAELSKLLLYVNFNERNTMPQVVPLDHGPRALPGVLVGDIAYEVPSPVFDPVDPNSQLCKDY